MTKRHDMTWALVLTLVAFVHRLIFLHSGYDTTWAFSLFYEGDSEPFFRYARAIIEGRAYDGGVPFHPPGFPYILAFIHTLVGAGEASSRVPNTTVRAVTAFMGSLSVGLTYLFVRSYLGRTVAVVASLAWAYAFAGYVIATTPASESVYQVLLLCALLVWGGKLWHPLAATAASGGTPPATARRREMIWALVLGVVLATLALVRVEGLLVAAVLIGLGTGSALIAGVRDRAGRERRFGALTPWGVAAAACVLALVPWTVRNHRALDEINYVMQSRFAEPLPTLVPLTAYGPLNLALANNPEATGRFSRAMLPDPTGTGALDLKNPRHLEVFLRGDEQAWAWIRENPGAFVRLVWRKWELAFSALRLGFTQWDVPGGLTGVRRPVDCFVPDDRSGARILGLLSLIGAVVLIRGRSPAGRRYLGVVGVVLLVPVVATGLFFGYARLVVVTLPLVYALAAVPIARLVTLAGAGWPRISRGEGNAESAAGRRAGTAGVLSVGGIMIVMLGIELLGARGGDRAFEVRGTVLEGRGVLNPNATVLISPLNMAAPSTGPRSTGPRSTR